MDDFLNPPTLFQTSTRPLDLLKQPPHSTTARKDLGMAIMQRVATVLQSRTGETL